MLTPRASENSGILIEFKKAKKEDGAVLMASAQEALEQIKNKSYATEIRSSGYQGSIFCYGIATHGKHVVVNMEIIPAFV